MDDLEFRRRCIADPFDQDEEFLRKKQENSVHAQFAERQVQFDSQIKDIMHGVRIPNGLQAHIQLRHAFTQRKVRRRFWTYSLPLVASTVFVSLMLLLLMPGSNDLQEVVLAHVYSELYHLDDRKDVQKPELRQILSSVGNGFKDDLGQVHYAGTCHIRKQSGVHLVLPGKVGPVTVLLMPGEAVEYRTAVADKRFSGVISQTPGGSMAILGEEGEDINNLEQQLKSQLTWAATG